MIVTACSTRHCAIVVVAPQPAHAHVTRVAGAAADDAVALERVRHAAQVSKHAHCTARIDDRDVRQERAVGAFGGVHGGLR